jgi:hypothetical protein
VLQLVMLVGEDVVVVVPSFLLHSQWVVGISDTVIADNTTAVVFTVSLPSRAHQVLALELEVSQANERVAAITEEMERRVQAAADELAASEGRRRAAEDEVSVRILEYMSSPSPQVARCHTNLNVRALPSGASAVHETSSITRHTHSSLALIDCRLLR